MSRINEDGGDHHNEPLEDKIHHDWRFPEPHLEDDGCYQKEPTDMNDRERFLATMRYEDRDRAPLCEMSFWEEVIDDWKRQGMPDHIHWSAYDDNTTDPYFGMDRYRSYTRLTCYLCPSFKEVVIEDRGDEELFQQADGVRVVRHKSIRSVPRHDAHLLTDRHSWQEHYKPRLDPNDPARLPDDWSARFGQPGGRDRTVPLVAEVGSLYGQLRLWMGLERISELIYDDPALLEEMIETMADLALGVLKRHFDADVQIDACYLWEDMCFNAGPLISPEHVRRFMLPHYRRITEFCRGHSVDIICLDTDGRIDHLVPIFLEAGINVLYPIEIGTTGSDPVELRRRFGRDLRMMGGFDKRILADSKRNIENEVDRLTPLVDDGGYIPMCDHYVPPGVPLENYIHYRKLAVQRWARGVNVKEMQC